MALGFAGACNQSEGSEGSTGTATVTESATTSAAGGTNGSAGSPGMGSGGVTTGSVVTTADNNAGGAPSTACERIVASVRACGLLGSGETDCDPEEETTELMLCFADCYAATPCEDLHWLFCLKNPVASLQSCITDCENASPQFTCDDGSTIPEHQACNSLSDCPDASDEADCPMFLCGDGKMVPELWVCDTITDCPDASDEADCAYNVEFTCSDGYIIPGTWVCDEEDDCADGGDEIGCPEQAKLMCQ